MGNTKTIKAFLSHRYKSTKINLYFFNLIKKFAEIQFEIDEGSLATNVTRLERMIFESDIFIGIFPLSSKLGISPAKSNIEKACRYFKLELDIASRQRKPTLCLLDNRYGNSFPISNFHYTVYYDSIEITSEGGFPNQEYFESKIQSFFNVINKKLDYETKLKSLKSDLGKIIIYCDEDNEVHSILKEPNLSVLKNSIEELFLKDVVIKNAPNTLNEKFYFDLKTIDFAIIDIAKNKNLALVLQANGIPQLRINSDKKISNFLFGNFTVGYNKDIINEDNFNSLLKEFRERLLTISAPKTRINTFDEAVEYFKKASLRNEAIFVSYSGKDKEIALSIIKKLKSKFSYVFNYRDKAESILPGRSWISEIFDNLAKSSLGILLYSEKYFDSQNCQHELRQIIALRDSKKIKVLPIKLYKNADLKIPNFAQDLQYIRYWEYEDSSEIINSAIRIIDENSI